MNWYVYCEGNPLTRVDWLGLKPVSIRSYVESRGGEVSRLYYDDFFNAVSVTFILNNRAISVTMSGENSHELTVKNVGDSLFAHDYDLQNFFYHGNTGTNKTTVNNNTRSSASGGNHIANTNGYVITVAQLQAFGWANISQQEVDYINSVFKSY